MIDSPWLVMFLACIYLLGAWGTYLVTTSNTGKGKLSTTERLQIERIGPIDAVLNATCLILSAAWPILWVLVVASAAWTRLRSR